MSYAHAPISEALLDIQTEDVGVDVRILKALGADSPQFPEVRDLRQLPARTRSGGEAETGPNAPLLGFQFWSADNAKVWQARRDGFSISHCKSYESWEALLNDGIPLWNRYRTFTGAKPTRLAVRYINRFDLPSDGNLEPRDYFRIVPELPRELDTGLAGWFMQLVLPQADLDAVAILTQTQVTPVRPGTASFVLDIDLSRTVDVPQNEAELWALFNRFRERKNHLFEMSLQDKARELFR